MISTSDDQPASTEALKRVLGLVLTLGSTPPTSPAVETEAAFRVLVFSEPLGYGHGSSQMGLRPSASWARNRDLPWMPRRIRTHSPTTNLGHSRAVVFLSATGDVLNPVPETAFMNYVLNGGVVAAIHAAILGPLVCEEECACGEGVIDWARVIRICRKAKRVIVLSVECGTVRQAEQSIAHLRELFQVGAEKLKLGVSI